MSMQVSCMSGLSASGVVRMKMLPAAPLVANGPLPKKNQRSTEITARSTRSSLRTFLAVTCQPISMNGCSDMFRPTPGRSTRGSIPTSRRCSAGPMPDSIRICGDEIAPPERITSLPARTDFSWPSCSYSTPTARLPSNSTRVIRQPDRRVRFGRFSAGSRKVREVAARRPRLVTVVSERWAPSVCSP